MVPSIQGFFCLTGVFKVILWNLHTSILKTKGKMGIVPGFTHSLLEMQTYFRTAKNGKVDS